MAEMRGESRSLSIETLEEHEDLQRQITPEQESLSEKPERKCNANRPHYLTKG